MKFFQQTFSTPYHENEKITDPETKLLIVAKGLCYVTVYKTI